MTDGAHEIAGTQEVEPAESVCRKQRIREIVIAMLPVKVVDIALRLPMR